MLFKSWSEVSLCFLCHCSPSKPLYSTAHSTRGATPASQPNGQPCALHQGCLFRYCRCLRDDAILWEAMQNFNWRYHIHAVACCVHSQNALFLIAGYRVQRPSCS